MKKLIVIALTLGLMGSSFADIQDPPANDYGPTRKFGRGVSNLLFAPTEIIVNINKLNKEEGICHGAIRALCNKGILGSAWLEGRICTSVLYNL